MKSSKILLASLLQEVSKLSGIPCSKEQALKENKSIYLDLDNYPLYGGYNLIGIEIGSGAHTTVFGISTCEARVKAPVMEQKLRGLIAGMRFMKENK